MNPHDEPATLTEAKRQRLQGLLLDALASGDSRTEAFCKAGVSRQAFYDWLRLDPTFADYVLLAEREALSGYDAALRRCAARAEQDPRYQRSLIYLAERQERRRRDQERREERREEQARKEREARSRPPEEISRKEFLRRAEQERERGTLPPFKPTGMPFFDQYVLSLDASNATAEQIADVERRCAEASARQADTAVAPAPAAPSAANTAGTPTAAPAPLSTAPDLPPVPPRSRTPYDGVTATLY